MATTRRGGARGLWAAGLAVVGLALAGLTVVTALVLGGGLTTVLQGPDDPVDSRAVFVIDHGRHSSIAIETASGDLVRYSYGDQRYYRDQDTSLQSGAAALLWPTAATLGRAQLHTEATAASLRAALVVGVEDILPLQVEGQRADRLMGTLDDLHSQGVADHVFVDGFGLVFAPHPSDYVWWNNSSTVIAGWLEELGVDVRGAGLVASWEIRET